MDASVAHFSGGVWLRMVPKTGWIAWDQAARGIVTYNANAGWAALPTGGGAGGPVNYNPFQKRISIPLASQFPTTKSTTGAGGIARQRP